MPTSRVAHEDYVGFEFPEASSLQQGIHALIVDGMDHRLVEGLDLSKKLKMLTVQQCQWCWATEREIFDTCNRSYLSLAQPGEDRIIGFLEFRVGRFPSDDAAKDQ